MSDQKSSDPKLHEGTLREDGHYCDNGDCWCWEDTPRPVARSSNDVVLPSWQECARAVENCVATALQIFIYHNEPSGDDSENFRDQLQAVLAMERSPTDETPKQLTEEREDTLS